MTNVSYVPVPASSAVLSPGGRLTLVSATPVMTADETAKGTIYYDTYEHNAIPINGANYTITSNELSLVLDSTNHKSGKLYDVFSIISAGAPTLVTGPAWTNSTTRSAAISLSLGVWTNTSDMAHAYNNSTDYGTVAAHTGLYLGTFYVTADGQTGMAFKPAAAAGGSNNILGLSNAYNRVPVLSIMTDSNATWTWNATTWHAADASTANRVTFVDGLQQSPIDAVYTCGLSPTGSSSDQPTIGVNLDSTSATPFAVSENAGATLTSATVADSFPPQLGLHYVQAMEAALNAGTPTFVGLNSSAAFQALRVGLWY